jgi:hypothetical protein
MVSMTVHHSISCCTITDRAHQLLGLSPPWQPSWASLGLLSTNKEPKRDAEAGLLFEICNKLGLQASSSGLKPSWHCAAA